MKQKTSKGKMRKVEDLISFKTDLVSQINFLNKNISVMEKQKAELKEKLNNVNLEIKKELESIIS